jgi:DNA end-binding protein Ku
MAQAVWVGDLSFGLVTIPIRLYTATSPKRVRFHQYEAGTGRRIRYRRVVEGPSPDDIPPPASEPEFEPAPSPAREPEFEPGLPEQWTPSGRDDAADSSSTEAEDLQEESEVPWEEIVRGYEVEPGRVVTVEADELESVAPERSRVLEVEQFVDLHDIDPVHFEKSYYVVPQRGGAAERPYWLLYRAMERAGKVAIGRFVMRTKEYLVALRPSEHVLMLQTLFYADEVRDPKEMWVPLIAEPGDREMQMAEQLVEMLAGEWAPDRHRDEHRDRLLDLIHSKVDEAVNVPEPQVEPPTAEVTDLMEALRASVEAAKQAREERGQTG